MNIQHYVVFTCSLTIRLLSDLAGVFYPFSSSSLAVPSRTKYFLNTVSKLSNLRKAAVSCSFRISIFEKVRNAKLRN